MKLNLQDIHEALYEVKASGRSRHDLQALLIHTDDLTDLLKSMPATNSGMGFDSIKLFGVKVIESKFAQKGTIFKIFKNDDQIHLTSTVGSGSIFPKSFQETIPPYGSGVTKPWTIDIKPWTVGIDPSPDKSLPFELPEDETPKKKKKKTKVKKKKRKHSNTRKIVIKE